MKKVLYLMIGCIIVLYGCKPYHYLLISNSNLNVRKYKIEYHKLRLIFEGGYDWLFGEMRGDIRVGIKNDSDKEVYLNVNNLLLKSKIYVYSFKFYEATQPETLWKGVKAIEIKEKDSNSVIVIYPRTYVYLDFELRTKVNPAPLVNESLDPNEVITLHLNDSIKLGDEVVPVEPIIFVPEKEKSRKE